MSDKMDRIASQVKEEDGSRRVHGEWRREGEESDRSREKETRVGGGKRWRGPSFTPGAHSTPVEPTVAQGSPQNTQAIGPLVPSHLIPSPSAEWIWDLVASDPLY